MRRLSITLLTCSALAAALGAQDQRKERPRMEATIEGAESGFTDGELEAGEEKKAEAGPVGPAAGLERFMAPVVSFKPRRLGPGESGEMHVVLAMQKTTVLTPTAHLELELRPEIGPLTFGPWQLNPPKPGTLDTAFRDQPVYDNFAHVVVPVTVAADAQFGDVLVTFRIIADVTDGQTGDVRGRMQASARGTAVIGDPMPRPIPQVAAGGEVRRGSRASAAAASDGAADAGAPGDRDAPAADDAVAGGREAPGGRAPVGADVPEPTGGALPMPDPAADWFWIAVGLAGAAMVGVVVALVRRG